MIDYKKIPLVFNVYKPVGISSFNVVYHFKKNLNFDYGKIGHFGTLDPFAEGVLLIGIQGAQRLNDYVHKLSPKTYRASGIFGGRTESGDLTSPILETKDIDESWINKTREEIESFLGETFLGEYWQSPHAISAVKFEGKRLYQHALLGRLIEKEKVKREIYSFKVLEFKYPVLDFEVTVSSGTYVRSLFEEIATLFNGVGALKTLVRTKIGELNISQSIEQANWPSKNTDFDLEIYGIQLDQVLELDHLYLNMTQTKLYLQGGRIPLLDVERKENSGVICSENYFWIYHQDGTLLGLGQPVEGLLHAIFNLSLSIAQFC